MKKGFKIFLIFFLCFCLIYGIVIYILLNNGKLNVFDETFSKNSSINDKEEFLFLMLGIDGKDLSKAKNARTDTMMLCKLNFCSGNVSILSIPRDTRVNIRGRTNKSKINAAHVYGGSELSVKTVKDLLNIDLKYYVKVDYKIVKEIVDLIGGVKVYVPKDYEYKDPTADPPLHINLKKGEQVLNGDKSLQFLRARKCYKGQDLDRIKAQQQFVEAFINQIKKFRNLTKLPKMVKLYYDYVDTNISMDLLLKLAFNIKKIDTNNIRMETLPGFPKKINGIDYIIYKEEDCLVKDMFENFMYNKGVE